MAVDISKEAEPGQAPKTDAKVYYHAYSGIELET